MPSPNHDPNNNAVKAALLLASTLTVLAGATVAPALPAMRAAFAGVDNVDVLVRLVLTLPALLIAILAPVSGAIIDRFGRKRVLVLAMIVYGAAGGSGLVFNSLGLILVGRALLGTAVAALMTAVTTLIADYYDGQQRASFMGLQAGFMGLGGVVFLTLGGVLADVHWRAPFAIYGLSLLLLPLVIRVLYEPTAAATVALDQPLANPSDCVGAVHRDDCEHMTTPIRLMVFTYGIIALVQVVFYVIIVQLPFHLEALLNATGSRIGPAVASVSLFFALTSMAYGRISRGLPRMLMLAGGLALVGGAYLLIGAAQGWALIIIGLPIAGTGFGLAVPTMNVWLAGETPAAVRGRVLSGLTSSVFVGQFASPLVSQPLVNTMGISSTFAVVGGALLVVSAGLFISRVQVAAWVTPRLSIDTA